MRMHSLYILALILWLTAAEASAQMADIQESHNQDSILRSAFTRLRAYDSTGNYQAAINELMAISWTFSLNSQISESMEAIQMARYRSAKHNDITMLGTIMMLSADNYKTLGAYGTALSQYYTADSLYILQGDFRNHVFSNYCKAYCYENRYEEQHSKCDIDSAVAIISRMHQYIDSSYYYHKPTIALIISRVLLSHSETLNKTKARSICSHVLDIIDKGRNLMHEQKSEREYVNFMNMIVAEAYIMLDSIHQAARIMDSIYEDRLNEKELRIYYTVVYKLNKRTGNYREALSALNKNQILTRRSFSAELASKSQKIEAREDFEALMRQYDEKHRKQEEEFEQKTILREKINSILVTTALILGAILIYLTINSIVVKRIHRERTEAKNEISEKNHQLKKTQETIIQQRAEIEAQIETIRMQTDTSRIFRMRMSKAIELARSIQNALMTSREMVHKYLGEHMIYWNSAAPVSGDFYWIRQSGRYTYLIAADATGHGVPGAFLSMLGITFMNDLGSEIDLSSAGTMPGTFLDILKQRFAKALGIGKNQMSDSMDLALIKIDKANRKITYSGANRPLLIVSNSEYREYKPTKMCIGYNILDRGSFANTNIEYQPGDMIYMFSDGYSDQFGGDDGHTKFGTRRLYELLSGMSYMPMGIQESILRAVFQTWIRNEYYNVNVDQIDDQLIIGIRMT